MKGPVWSTRELATEFHGLLLSNTEEQRTTKSLLCLTAGETPWCSVGSVYSVASLLSPAYGTTAAGVFSVCGFFT